MNHIDSLDRVSSSYLVKTQRIHIFFTTLHIIHGSTQNPIRLTFNIPAPCPRAANQYKNLNPFCLALISSIGTSPNSAASSISSTRSRIPSTTSPLSNRLRHTSPNQPTPRVKIQVDGAPVERHQMHTHPKRHHNCQRETPGADYVRSAVLPHIESARKNRRQ